MFSSSIIEKKQKKELLTEITLFCKTTRLKITIYLCFFIKSLSKSYALERYSPLRVSILILSS